MPQIYGSPHAGSIADLMRQQGAVRARQAEAQGQAEAARAAASGQIWGQAIQNIGQGVSGTLADFAKRRQGPTPDDVYKIAQVQKIRAELAQGDETAKRTKIGEMASLIAASGYKPEAAEPLFRVIASESPEYEQPLMRSLMDPAALKRVTDQLRTLSPGYKAPGTRQIETAGPNGPQIQIVEDVPGQTFAKPQEPEKPVVVQGALVKPSSGEVVYQAPEKPEREPNPTEASLALKAAGGDPRKALQLLQAQRPASADTQRSDAEAIADAIASGQQPPEVTGLYRLAGPVRAELQKRGYDLAKANLDWKATQRHLTTLNGAQQTRLRQAIITASDSLDAIQQLADQWKGGRFPILNKANLAAAKNGAYGSDVASIATQLEGQITDVTSELANAYMGGNSPTDHALQLAAKNLSANWDQKVLTDMVKLARTNLAIRRNSIEQATPITATSQQQLQAEPKIDEEWIIVNGKLEKKKKGKD